MKKTIALGIAGYGYWGPNLLRNFDALPGVRVEAVCDPDPVRLARVASSQPSIARFTRFEHLLAHPRLDAIAVATPPATHHALALSALLAGKHVMVEKPMATTARDCRTLIAVAEARDLTLMVGHTYMYAEAVREMLRIIARGDIGDVRYINCQRLNLGLFQTDINVAWDLAPHDLSIILSVMGTAPETINCQGNAHVNPNVEDICNISLTFPGRRFATIQNSWLEPRKVRQVTVVGTRGMIVYDDLQPNGKILVHDVRVDCPPHYENFGEFHYAYHYGDCRIPRIEQSEPLARMCAHFIHCVREHRIPDSCGHHGLEVVRILQACTESLRQGGAPVSIPTIEEPAKLRPMATAV